MTKHPKTRLRTVMIAVAASLATALALVAQGGAAAKTAPKNTLRPTIAGADRQGSTLTAYRGEWSGSNPKSFSYAWLRCDGNGNNCAAIIGATKQRYTLVAADVLHRIRVVVKATNADGSALATSAPTAVVQPPASSPTNRSAPTISGTTREGQTLTAGNGSWTGTGPITYGYEWQRCDEAGASCTAISGATGATYTLTSADVGKRIRVQVTAKNAKGSQSALSGATDLISPAKGGTGPAISVASVSPPNRLVISSVKFSPQPIRSRGAFTGRFRVSDTRGLLVQGALVYLVGLPYSWLQKAPEVTTDSTGWATMTLRPGRALPLKHGTNLVMFVRARKPGDNLLAGVSTRRLVQASVSSP